MKVTAKLTSDFQPEWLFFIDGVLELTSKGLQQKGYSSEKEAMSEGFKRVKQLKK